jgi:hypothetical protein
MKKLLITAGMTALLATAAFAQDKPSIAISTGMEGGGYHTHSMKMAERLAQRGYSTVAVNATNGSDAITLAACNGKADVWTAQIDAVYTRHKEGCTLDPVADYGTEMAFLLFPPNSDMSELDELTSANRIAVDGIGSGTELFWKTIVSIEVGENGDKDDWAKAGMVESAPDLLNTMANFGDIHAAILVRKPDSPHIKMLLDQGWTLGYFWDRDIDDEIFNSLPLYASEKISVKNSNNKVQKNYVYHVRSFIGVSAKHKNDRKFKMDVAGAAN